MYFISVERETKFQKPKELKMFKIEKQPVHFSNHETKWYKVFVNGKQYGTISYEKGLGYAWSERGGFFSTMKPCKVYVERQLLTVIYASADAETQAKLLKTYGQEMVGTK